eukprot:354135-Chlamydomonas_euryale.AAC.11
MDIRVIRVEPTLYKCGAAARCARWDYGVPGMVDTAKALADCQAKGLIKHIGTTNLNVEALQALVAAEVPVACSQVQFSLLDRRPLNGMLDFCQNNNIKVFSYGSVAGGLLSDRCAQTLVHVCWSAPSRMALLT